MSTRQPLRGYNHNVRHLDMVFHIQTEDSGVKAPHIFTHCFHEGSIVATKKRDYPADATEDVVRSAMKEQHKELMRELKNGIFDAKIRQYFGAQAAEAGAQQVADADAAAAAAVAEVKKAAYERLLAEAKDLDSALEMELVADEPPPGAAPVAEAAEWPGPGEGAKLPTGLEWPGPTEGAKLPTMPEWPGPGEGAKLPAMAAAAAGPPEPVSSSPAPTGVAETPPAMTSADWSSVRAVLASLGAEQGDAGLAVATYSPGDLSGSVSVVTFNESAAGQSVKAIDLGALPPGHTLPPAPKPRSERNIWAIKGTMKERPLEESGPVAAPPGMSAVGPGAVTPERVEAWPVLERVAAQETETLPEPPDVVFHQPGAAPAAPPPPPAVPAGTGLPQPPGVSLRPPAAAPHAPAAAPHAPVGLPRPPGVSLRPPAGASLPEPPPTQRDLRPPAAPTPPVAPTARPATGTSPRPAAGTPPQQSVSLRPSVPPPVPPAPAAPNLSAALASAAPPPTGIGMVRPPARPAAPASDGHSVSMPSRTVPPAARGEPAAPSSQQVVTLKPPSPPARMPTPARHPPRQYVSIASADGVVMTRSPMMVGGASPGAARAGTRAPTSANAAVRTTAASRPAVPVLPAAAHAPAAPRPPAAAAGAGAPPAAAPPAPAPGAPAPEGESIFGTAQASEKSLHEIILSYLSGEDKPK